MDTFSDAASSAVDAKAWTRKVAERLARRLGYCSLKSVVAAENCWKGQVHQYWHRLQSYLHPWKLHLCAADLGQFTVASKAA